MINVSHQVLDAVRYQQPLIRTISHLVTHIDAFQSVESQCADCLSSLQNLYQQIRVCQQTPSDIIPRDMLLGKMMHKTQLVYQLFCGKIKDLDKATAEISDMRKKLMPECVLLHKKHLVEKQDLILFQRLELADQVATLVSARMEMWREIALTVTPETVGKFAELANQEVLQFVRRDLTDILTVLNALK